MRITVLGKSPAWQDAGGACSGYLVEHEGFVLLLDCGNGVFAQLRRHIEYVDVDAVLITHLHGDHFLDLVPYSHALMYAPRQQRVAVAGWPGTDRPARPVLHAPPGSTDTFRRLAATFGPADLIESSFDLREYDGRADLAIGPFRIRLTEVPHYTRTFAVDFTDPDGARFTFSADCCPNDELVELARGTDLLLIEATLPQSEPTGTRGHLTPSEAGGHARRAGAGHVVLTHFSDELNPAWMAAEAAASFGATVTLAREGAVYTPHGAAHVPAAGPRPRAIAQERGL